MLSYKSHKSSGKRQKHVPADYAFLRLRLLLRRFENSRNVEMWRQDGYRWFGYFTGDENVCVGWFAVGLMVTGFFRLLQAYDSATGILQTACDFLRAVDDAQKSITTA